MGGTIYDDTGDLLRTFLSIPIPESFIASRYTPRHWTGIIYWQEVWKSPACLWSANDSVRLTEIRDRGLRRNDSIRSGWAGGDRRLKANDVELVSDIITKERRSRPLPNAARIPSPPPLSNCERRRDPLDKWSPELASSFWSGKLRFTNLFHTFWKRFFSSLRVRCPSPPPPPSIFALEKNSLSFNGVVPHLFANS